MKQSVWIPVSERVPEADEMVLIWSNTDPGDHRPREIGCRSSQGYWYTYPNDGDGRWDVTHWMPLPSPPETT